MSNPIHSMSPRPTPMPVDSGALIRDARLGRAGALGALYEQHAARLLRVAWRITGAVDDAEDVVHDVFVGLPEALRHYDERGRLDAWLAQVTVRTALMRRRRERRQYAETADTSNLAHTPDAALHAELIDVERALTSLPDAIRDVYLLHQVEGFTHAHIGTLLGISPGASRVRLCRALDALRVALHASR